MRPADVITVCRILLSVVLLFIPPLSVSFFVIYLLCGLSDMADGFTARKMHNESETGAKLDSIADIVFFAVCAVKLLPLVRLDAYIWVWTAVIAVIKIAGILMRFARYRKFSVPHSIANKLTGALLFILPLTISFVKVRYSAAVVCIAASYAAVRDVLSCKKE